MANPVNTLNTGSRIAAQGLTSLNDSMFNLSDTLGAVGGGFAKVFKSLETGARELSKYTLSLDDAARVAMRGTSLYSTNAAEFKKFSRSLQDQATMFSELTGKSREEAVKEMAAVQSAIKGYGDYSTAISLSGRDLNRMSENARIMAKALPGSDEFKKAEKAYNDLNNTIPQSEQDMLLLNRSFAHLSTSMGVSGAEFAKFVDTVQGAYDLDPKETAKLSSVMGQFQERYNMSFSEQQKVLKDNQDAIMAVDGASRVKLQTALLQNAAEIKKAGVDFSAAAKKIAGEEGASRIEQAAMLTAFGGGSFDENMADFALSDMGDAKAQGRIMGRQNSANQSILGQDPEMDASIQRSRDNNIPMTASQNAYLAKATGVDSEIALQMGGNILGKDYKERSSLNEKVKKWDQEMEREARDQAKKGRIAPKTNAQIIADGVTDTNRATTDEKIASQRTRAVAGIEGAATDLLGPDALDDFNNLARDKITVLNGINEFIATASNIIGSGMGAVEGFKDIGHATRVSGQKLTKAEFERSRRGSTALDATIGVGVASATLGGVMNFGTIKEMLSSHAETERVLDAMRADNEEPSLDSGLDRDLLDTGPARANPEINWDYIRQIEERGGIKTGSTAIPLGGGMGGLLPGGVGGDLGNLLPDGKGTTMNIENANTNLADQGLSMVQSLLSGPSVADMGMDALASMGITNGRLSKSQVTPTANMSQTQRTKTSSSAATPIASASSTGDKMQELIDAFQELASNIRNIRASQEPSC